MRGLGKLTAAYPTTPAFAAVAAQSLLAASSSSSSHAFSTFSGGGGGGGGGGRGRGSGPPLGPPPPSRSPGRPQAEDEDAGDDFPASGLGHGRGQPILPSSAILSSFSTWMSSPPPPSAAGRGRGQSTPLPPGGPAVDSIDSHLKNPIFLRSSPERTQFADPDEAVPLPSILSSGLPGAGRGKPTRPVVPNAGAGEENRHLRTQGPPGGSRRGRGAATVPRGPSLSPPRVDREEAMKKAVEVLSRGGDGRGQGVRGGGGGERGRGRARAGGWRGRGGRSGRGRRDADEDFATGLYLGDNADGEKLKKRLGDENMNKLVEGFEEMSLSVLPSPMDDAYLDALHTNYMIEFEPEYIMEFDTNPDIDEKPPIPLREALEKMKPFLMEYEAIQSQEEWEEVMKETMEKAPYLKELVDYYSGPDRVTAKQQQQELERVAKTLPENIPSSVNRFTDRVLLSLQGNPGWGFDKKCQFMDKLVWEVSQHYK